jgi:GNAT superfamily N-acetyltransferase
MNQSGINLRPATRDDLEAINRVVEAALRTWALPERVKRLSLPGYRYTGIDLEHLEMVVAVSAQLGVVGVAAWEPAEEDEAPAGHTALLLHGIYVDPTCHRQGIGSRLLEAAELAICRQGRDGLLVRAQPDATGFFVSRGMGRVPVKDPARQYANRFWKPVAVRSCAVDGS